MRTLLIIGSFAIGLSACGSGAAPGSCSPAKVTDCVPTASGGCVINHGTPAILAALCTGGDAFYGCSPTSVENRDCEQDCSLAPNCKNP